MALCRAWIALTPVQGREGLENSAQGLLRSLGGFPASLSGGLEMDLVHAVLVGADPGRQMNTYPHAAMHGWGPGEGGLGLPSAAVLAGRLFRGRASAVRILAGLSSARGPGREGGWILHARLVQRVQDFASWAGAFRLLLDFYVLLPRALAHAMHPARGRSPLPRLLRNLSDLRNAEAVGPALQGGAQSFLGPEGAGEDLQEFLAS